VYNALIRNPKHEDAAPPAAPGPQAAPRASLDNLDELDLIVKAALERERGRQPDGEDEGHDPTRLPSTTT
jgi:hypothetical protein